MQSKTRGESPESPREGEGDTTMLNHLTVVPTNLERDDEDTRERTGGD